MEDEVLEILKRLETKADKILDLLEKMCLVNLEE